MFKKWGIIVSHILFWCATSWFFISTFGIEQKEVRIINGEETVQLNYNTPIAWQLVWSILFSAMVVYASAYTILKFNTGRIKSFGLSLLYFALIFLLYIFFRQVKILPSSPIMPIQLIAGIFTFYYISGIAYSIFLLWQNTEKMRMQMEGEKKEAELNLLRSQLRPHFLFNVLNSMLSMVDRTKNPELIHTIHLLSNLLRYVVNETNKGKVPVHKEIEFIKDYSALQRLRFEEKELNFILDVTGEYVDQEVEPGLFIPFIENAFKYGTEPEKISDIHVGFDFTLRNKIKFTISNTIYEGLIYFEGNGLGIAAAKKRLDMVYPKSYILKYGKLNDTYTVNLEINTDESNYSR